MTSITLTGDDAKTYIKFSRKFKKGVTTHIERLEKMNEELKEKNEELAERIRLLSDTENISKYHDVVDAINNFMCGMSYGRVNEDSLKEDFGDLQRSAETILRNLSYAYKVSNIYSARKFSEEIVKFMYDKGLLGTPKEEVQKLLRKQYLIGKRDGKKSVLNFLKLDKWYLRWFA